MVINPVRIRKVYFVWHVNNGCSVKDCENGVKIGHTDTIPYRVSVVVSGVPTSVVSRVIQYGGCGFVYINHKGQRHELYYNMFESIFSI